MLCRLLKPEFRLPRQWNDLPEYFVQIQGLIVDQTLEVSQNILPSLPAEKYDTCLGIIQEELLSWVHVK